jgi:hypothetical protein
MTCSSHAIEQALAELAWSLWTEFGVSGVFRHHADWNIDLEPLIVLTAALADVDPRLRDESTDWCIRYARLIAAVRLKALVRHADPETVSAFAEYAATVRAHARTNWPGTGTPRAYQPTGRSRLDSLDRPAHFGVRQRALFGTGARAEVVRLLASDPDHTFSAAELADEAAFTKRAVEQELESLRLAGVVTWTALHGRRRIRVARRDELLAFAGSRPQWIPRWAPLVRVLLGGLRLVSHVENSAPIVRTVEARKYLRTIRPDIDQAGLTPPAPVTESAGHWDELLRWFGWVTSALAAGDPDIFARGWLSAGRSAPLSKPPEDER